MKPPLKESWVKDQIKKILKEYGAVYCMPATGGFGKSGVSDFLICYKGWFISVEAKAGKGTTTALQDKWLEDIHEAGGLCLVVNEDNLGDLRDLLNDISYVAAM